MNYLERQYGKYGHSITFPHDAPHRLTSAPYLKLPRTTGYHQFLSLHFIGARREWEAFVPELPSLIHDVVVRADLVYAWLRFLKAVNPLYKDVEIDESSKTL